MVGHSAEDVDAIAIGAGALINRDPLNGAFAGLALTTTALGTILPILVLAVMVSAAIWLSLDMLLGAFTAGIISRLLLSDVPEAEEEVIDAKLEGIGFGFLVPVFFVVSGMNFDLDALLSDPGTLLLVPIFLLLFAALLAPPELGGRDRVALGLFGATALPLVVVITTIEVEADHLPSSTAAALVGAGMLSVLLFPLLAQRHSQITPDCRAASSKARADWLAR
ncbi:cation:proton antiporter domain-containing protein [Kitasatospora sp. P5_F3]